MSGENFSYQTFAEEVAHFCDATPATLNNYFQSLSYVWINLDPRMDPCSKVNCRWLYEECVSYATTGTMPQSLKDLKAGWGKQKEK